MRFAFVFLCLLCISSKSIAQTTLVKVIFTIEDFDTHKGMPGALVQVRQTASTQATLADGKVTFNNVPVGEIEYYIMKEGYQFETGRVNVSTDEKTNIFRISISKIDDKKILVTGEVTDGEGRDVEDAWVEVKIADQVRTVMTDASGNYSADIAPSSKYPSSTMRIEVKKGDCKKTETVDIPRTNVVYKDFKLDCNSVIPPPPPLSLAKFEYKEWVFEMLSCTQSGDRVECRVRATSVGKDNFLNPGWPPKRIITSTGNEYQFTEIKLGDKINEGKDFVADVPVNCIFIASNVKEKVDIIAKFECFFNINNNYGNDVIPVFRNIPVK